MIKNPEIQFMSAARIKQYQKERLRETLDYLACNSPFYKKMFAERGIDVGRIKTIEDLRNVPITTKQDLQLHGADFLCVPPTRIIDYVTTSGTLGDPITFGLTSSDLDRLAYNEASSFSTAGIRPGDVIQLMTTLDRRFMAGLAYFMGARELGCGIVRVGNGIPELQWDTIMRIKPTVCIVVPSFLVKLIDYAEANGIDYRGSSLRKAVCIGEALRGEDNMPNTLGRRISEKWDTLSLHSTYASTEMQTSFTECEKMHGGHLPPDLIIVELLDEDDRPVEDGSPGEVTVTTLGVEGMPLLRFKTGDICRRMAGPCGCGRNTVRLGYVMGRKGQMIKFKGTTLYPPAIYDVLDTIPEITNYYVEVSKNDLDTDLITVKICSEDRSERFVKHVKDLFRSRIRVAPELVFESAEAIARFQMPPMNRKPKKIVNLKDK